MNQKTGIFATLAIIAAIGSYIATFTGHPIIGLIAALASIPLGLVGMLMAASPTVSGGLMSIFSMFLGVCGLGVAVLGLIGVIIF